MRILFITYPMAFHTPGGGEIQLLNYKIQLEEIGHEVSLFDLWNPNFKSHDIVHFFSCIAGSEPICAFVKQLGLPLAISSSLWITEKNRDHYDIGMIRSQLTHADVIVTNSIDETVTLSNVLNMEKERFRHVLNGVDQVFFDAQGNPSFIEEYKVEPGYVLCVANIEPRKNQHALIQAMKHLPDRKLMLIGHVRDEDYFRKCGIAENDQVCFIGGLEPNSELLISAYQNAAVFCLPSTLETPGIAALEAAAVGTPIVITAEGCTKEYFQSGVEFVDHQSIESIASGLATALSSGAKAGGLINPWSEIVRDLERVYTSTLVREGH